MRLWSANSSTCPSHRLRQWTGLPPEGFFVLWNFSDIVHTCEMFSIQGRNKCVANWVHMCSFGLISKWFNGSLCGAVGRTYFAGVALLRWAGALQVSPSQTGENIYLSLGNTTHVLAFRSYFSWICSEYGTIFPFRALYYVHSYRRACSGGLFWST